MARLRYNNALGTLGGSLTNNGTTITFAVAPAFATIVAPDYIPLVLEPPSGSAPSANFEIVYLTAYTAGATTGTILRGQEGTTGVSHSNGVTWVHGASVADQVGLNMAFGGFPPAFVKDWSLDGTTPVTYAALDYGFFGNSSGSIASLASTTYTAAQFGSANYAMIFARNFTLANTYTLKGPVASGGIVIVASSAITINGTIDCSGAPASGATGGAGNGAGAYPGYYRGFAGANGSTGAGGAGTTNGGTGFGPGGGGGAGGNSGGTNGGGNTSQFAPNGLPGLGGTDLLFMRHNQQAAMPGGAFGGSSGAGDGANAGGGGGAGGGCLILIAPTITLASTAILKTTGGNGANGVAGNAGGGGGGGGAPIALHALAFSINPSATLNANGGTGGTGSGTGGNGGGGSPGNGTSSTAGTYFFDPPVAKGGFNFGQNILICKWQ